MMETFAKIVTSSYFHKNAPPQKCSTIDVGQDPKHVSDPLSFVKMMLAENVQNNWRKFFL